MKKKKRKCNNRKERQIQTRENRRPRRYAYFPYLHQNVGSMLAYVREVGAPDAAHLHAH